MSIDCMWAVYTDIQSIYSPKDKNLLAGQGARGLEALAALQLFLTPRGGCSGTVVQVQFGVRMQGATRAEFRAGWRPQRRRFWGASRPGSVEA